MERAITFCAILCSILVSTNGFKLKETRPQNATVEEGGTIELYCAVDDWWEWCTFRRGDAAICDFEWRKDVANVTVADCDAFAGRYEYFGDYNQGRVSRIYRFMKTTISFFCPFLKLAKNEMK